MLQTRLSGKMAQKLTAKFRILFVVFLLFRGNLNCEAYESNTENENENKNEYENDKDNVILDASETQYTKTYDGADYVESPAIWEFRIEACNFMRTTCGEWFPLGKGKK